MWYTYIIQSLVDGSYYIGSTHDVLLRLERHNTGWTKSTKKKRPWKLVYTEEYATKSEALEREHRIKSWKSRKMIERLIRTNS
jgi:putative endonuclease